MNHTSIAIIGAGIAGLTVAHFLNNLLGAKCTVFESTSHPGGIASSFALEDFIFDNGIHGLYTKNQSVMELLSKAISNEHRSFNISIADYWKGQWAKHPIYYNLGDLGLEDTTSFLIDFIENYRYQRPDDSISFKTWCLNQLGEKISNEFIFPYIRKFWTVEPEVLTTQWMGERIKIPSTRDIVIGSLINNRPNHHYVKNIYYPYKGGFGAYASAIASKVKVKYGKKVTYINTSDKILEFSDGSLVSYEYIISTIPLPSLLSLVSDVHPEVIAQRSKLRKTSLALISLAIDHPQIMPHHWVYVHDPEIPFARLSSPSLWAEANAPIGKSSLQAEVYYRDEVPNSEELLNIVVDCLQEMKLLKSQKDIIISDVRFLPYGNVIHDHDRSSALDVIHNFLEERKIFYCGRYGFWDYSLLDEVIVRAHEVASQIGERKILGEMG